jgi:hypothetical protein
LIFEQKKYLQKLELQEILKTIGLFDLLAIILFEFGLEIKIEVI